MKLIESADDKKRHKVMSLLKVFSDGKVNIHMHGTNMLSYTSIEDEIVFDYKLNDIHIDTVEELQVHADIVADGPEFELVRGDNRNIHVKFEYDDKRYASTQRAFYFKMKNAVADKFEKFGVKFFMYNMTINGIPFVD